MKKNVGAVDRVIRIIAGIVIIMLGIVFKSWWGIIGIIPLGTAFLGICPMYSIFGISTCKLKE